MKLQCIYWLRTKSRLVICTTRQALIALPRQGCKVLQSVSMSVCCTSWKTTCKRNGIFGTC